VIADAFYPARGVRLAVEFDPIDTNTSRVPEDLRRLPFDDPRVIGRFERAADHLLSKLSHTEIVPFSIGNEIDGLLGDDRARWDQYARFFSAAADHVGKRRPGTPVGAKVMRPALLAPEPPGLTRLLEASNVTLATYYPLKADFSVREPSVVGGDLERLMKRHPERPVYLLETGYPSSAGSHSTPGRQARFVREMFRTWDRLRPRLRLVSFEWLHDLSPSDVEGYARYFGIGSRSFAAYLGSLGLRSRDGRDKPVFRALLEESAWRSWAKKPEAGATMP